MDGHGWAWAEPDGALPSLAEPLKARGRAWLGMGRVRPGPTESSRAPERAWPGMDEHGRAWVGWGVW